MTDSRAAPRAGRAENLGSAVVDRCRSVLDTGARRVIVALTLVAGVAAAVAVAAGSSPDERTFGAVSGPVQSLMSVTVPFLGVLLVHDIDRPASRRPLVASIAAALVVAVAVGAFGVAVSAAALALTESRAPGGPWQHVPVIAIGGLLVQCLAQSVGTGVGLLVRRPVVASLLTAVVPLGLWLLLGATSAVRPAQAWLTPFAPARHLLAGTMTPAHWAQWLVVAAIWGVALNLVASRRATDG